MLIIVKAPGYSSTRTSLMVEPFAAVVFNKLLSGRPTLSYPVSLNSVARVITSSSSSRKSVGTDFFLPLPGHVKGKDKSGHDFHDASHLSQCQEWSSCSSRHTLRCPYQSRFMMLGELSHDRSRVPRCYKSHPPSGRRIASGPFQISATYGGQRRHASHASEGAAINKPESPSLKTGTLGDASSARRQRNWSKGELHIQKFERVTQTPRARLDMDHAWKTYQAVKDYDLPLASKLAFVDKYLSAAEMRYRHNTGDKQLHGWGRRATEVLDTMSNQVIPSSRFDQWRLCLVARSMALFDDLENATRTLHDADKVPMLYNLKAGIPYAYEMIISSISRYRGNACVIEFIAQEWPELSTYLLFDSMKSHYGAQARAGASMRRVAFRAATEIVDRTSFLERDDWDKKRREAIGCFFLDALCFSQMAREARDVVLKMQQLHLHLPLTYKLMTIRTLAQRAPLLRYATDLHSAIPAEDCKLSYLQTGLYVYARQGNTEVAERYFDDILARGDPGSEDIAAVIHAYAVANDTNRATAVFSRFFPLDAKGKRQNSPALTHYAAILSAFSRLGDQAGITRWLQDLANAGLVPNDHIFTIVLNAFAHAGDIDSVTAILKQMREAGIQPNVVTYTIVITLLAHRKDSVGAEAIFKRALKEGIIPDNRMIISLMNAHVEAGSWKGVIRAYDYLAASHFTTLSIDVYNTLMKAYVLIGAPFSVVYKFFKRLEASRAEPDAYTYSLLVQSACDAGMMNIASDIYYDMEQLALENPNRNFDVNVYILTILMAGFLQHGDKIRAKAVYDEMRDKGIQPTPITFSTIIKAYGNERSKESLQIAEDFVRSLVADPEAEQVLRKPKYDAKTALQHLYGPLISAYGKMQKPEEAERVLHEMFDAEGTPSLGMLSALLDVHRRTFNVDAVLALWPKIYNLGMELSRKDWFIETTDSLETRGLRGNILCVPLSIYIDALSAAGHHSEIAAVWKDFRAQGFSFDSHNWNHLCVALVRAGQLERAFEVVERVLIPFQELSARSDQPRDRGPGSPLVSDLHTEKDEDLIEEAPGEPPKHRADRRVLASKIATSRTARMEGWDAEEHGSDLAHHLHILQQISPSWATWRPHSAALTVLLTSINRLNAGMLVKPILANDGDEVDTDADERPEAREMLNRLYSNYPKTVGVVLDHEMRERQRLGSDYDEEYNWG
ncbi:hypothetical protein D9615_000625 [Tricholomella constricta]|uniref:Uncharacterized protein n=1 Tax=Tricholomella constricta TaxID=117010 RepID=A0A8H5HQT2_9AGAR|nr:hypothetical protein D9615_000625 [Tricholomella constricta]